MFKKNFKPYRKVPSGSSVFCCVSDTINESIVSNVFNQPSQVAVKKSFKSMENIYSENPKLDAAAVTLEAQLASGKTLKEVSSQVFTSSTPSSSDVELAEKLIESDSEKVDETEKIE